VFDVVGCEEKVGGDDIGVSVVVVVVSMEVDVGAEEGGVGIGSVIEIGWVGLPVPDVRAEVAGARRPTFNPGCRLRL
jgi:hypothetical protein